MNRRHFLNSAFDLKNVSWRYGNLQPYAITWIDSGGKCSTKIDTANDVNPVWNEMFTIRLPSTSHPETAVLYIDVVHGVPAADMKVLVGSAKLPLGAAINDIRSKGKAKFSLTLERPSGRPQGSLEIQIDIQGPNGQQARHMAPQPQAQPQPQPYIQPQPQVAPQPQPRPKPYVQQLPPQQQPQPQPQPYVQQAQYMSPQPQPQPQPQPFVQQGQNMPFQPQLRPRPRLQPQYQMNQIPMGPGYPTNLPQNVRPAFGQQPRNAMMMQPMMRPQYRPAVNTSSVLADALCTLAIGVSPRQVGRMFGSVRRMGSVGMARNAGNNGANVNYGNNPSALQQQNNNPGYDTTATYDNTGYDGSTYGDGQYSTDGGYGDGQYGTDGGYGDGQFSADGGYGDGMFGTDGGYGDAMFGTDGGLGGGGFDMGMFDTSGLDLGGFDTSGIDVLGGLG